MQARVYMKLNLDMENFNFMTSEGGMEANRRQGCIHSFIVHRSRVVCSQVSSL